MHSLPSLPLTGLLLTLGLAIAAPAQAQDRFNPEGIQFEVDTIVEFGFLESNGVYQSTFGVINLETGEKTPLLVEVKPSDVPQPVQVPSDFMDDAGLENRDDFLGTPGNTVPEPIAEFLFEANTAYAFYLESFYEGQSAGILYSTDLRNGDRRSRVLFEGDLANGGVILRWDDSGSVLVDAPRQDQDFDDFIVQAGGHLDCPYTGD